jgi:antitoxin component YwqK of YwqJK toxin-antitoxin module
LEGQLEGKAQHWNESGVLIFEAEYKDGKQHGKFMKYYDNGNPRLEQYFIEGKLDGVKKSFDAEGNVVETRYENGVKAS